MWSAPVGCQMTVATDDDLVGEGTVDDEGCVNIEEADLETHFNAVKHGRAWVVHLWIDPEGGAPVSAIEDPWRRWEDAPDRVAADESGFFVAKCGCG